MVQTIDNPTVSPAAEQHFTWRGLTWHQFKAIQASFENVPGVRLFYCQGVLEIVGINKPHEAFKSIIGVLLAIYFEVTEIEFFPSGAYSQIGEGQVEYQADLSYCFGTDKDVPDLCVEVVITSGSPIKLQKYRVMGVPEVWFWEDGTLELYHLREQGYERITNSELLSELDLSVWKRCILLASPPAALQEFRRGISSND
ncbi:MAG: Uma2 family endonuclease [Microcoleus sp. PH2017_10_PVI_O_A]|uniref:Uma2 family endonuclease n=1 Tax=unclassified Microcoleus TaxID=2642155 RepID=UPI001D5EC8DC|nr:MULTISPECIES: Uma2 family endonuclease [unclassified Microcoleus]TAE85916.1 MAG: Uma2 family endonuclease [Oscillatoriales cyanobacterium]MCC3404090.1 Uma2 family endonuclease [Microcoleus sp. PH2017_10_PVI_O_A]MCC3458173.1 Uma2 family endonuclease [Microcoleus sp. PH2017_11_PCY_U_A]MCC3476595.1 Uma2 family endonuclease [Microcoleus sp. PH2017_12_PCY_D_A]MCC3527872.1 Uma2 family endonuclease [Microcoleus sp. PH2017_21_RUC_O_A]